MDAIIENLIAEIDWNIVRAHLTSDKKLSETELEKLVNWEKVILKRRIYFLINSTMDRLECRNWLIKCPGKGLGKNKKAERVNVQFIPFSISVNLIDREVPIMKQSAKNPEWESLYKLLHYYSDQEEYEVCNHIKNRLNEIIEEMRINDKP